MRPETLLVNEVKQPPLTKPEPKKLKASKLKASKLKALSFLEVKQPPPTSQRRRRHAEGLVATVMGKKGHAGVTL